MGGRLKRRGGWRGRREVVKEGDGRGGSILSCLVIILIVLYPHESDTHLLSLCVCLQQSQWRALPASHAL